MGGSDLLLICGSAFLTVFIILSLLAMVMRLIIVVFPHRELSSDPAVFAAMSAVISKFYKGMKISKIEEIK
jgi:hypothetical protein